MLVKSLMEGGDLDSVAHRQCVRQVDGVDGEVQIDTLLPYVVNQN